LFQLYDNDGVVEARIVMLERELKRLRHEPAAQDSQMYVDSIKFVCFLYHISYCENVSSINRNPHLWARHTDNQPFPGQDQGLLSLNAKARTEA